MCYELTKCQFLGLGTIFAICKLHLLRHRLGLGKVSTMLR